MSEKVWTYDELMEATEKEVIHLMNLSHNAATPEDQNLYRAQAIGVYMAWAELVYGHTQGDDIPRIRAILGDPPEARSAMRETLERICRIADDESRWQNPAEAAFNRGTIIGMCHRVGVIIPRDTAKDSKEEEQ